MSAAIKELFDNNNESSEPEEESLCTVVNYEPELISDIDRTPVKYAVSKVVDTVLLDEETLKPWSKQRYRIDLAAQQVECELNYARLSRLLVDLPTRNEWCFEIGDQQIQSYFIANILDRAPYTTTIQLNQYFASSFRELKKQYCFNASDVEENHSDEKQQTVAESLGSSSISSKITVCMYHDASMAEVIAWKNHKRLRARYEYPNKHMYHQDEKAQLNKFLGDWLTLCQQKGRVVLDLKAMGIKSGD